MGCNSSTESFVTTAHGGCGASPMNLQSTTNQGALDPEKAVTDVLEQYNIKLGKSPNGATYDVYKGSIMMSERNGPIGFVRTNEEILLDSEQFARLVIDIRKKFFGSATENLFMTTCDSAEKLTTNVERQWLVKHGDDKYIGLSKSGWSIKTLEGWKQHLDNINAENLGLSEVHLQWFVYYPNCPK